VPPHDIFDIDHERLIWSVAFSTAQELSIAIILMRNQHDGFAIHDVCTNDARLVWWKIIPCESYEIVHA
jgi:hypothetical protein